MKRDQLETSNPYRDQLQTNHPVERSAINSHPVETLAKYKLPYTDCWKQITM